MSLCQYSGSPFTEKGEKYGRSTCGRDGGRDKTGRAHISTSHPAGLTACIVLVTGWGPGDNAASACEGPKDIRPSTRHLCSGLVQPSLRVVRVPRPYLTAAKSRNMRPLPMPAHTRPTHCPQHYSPLTRTAWRPGRNKIRRRARVARGVGAPGPPISKAGSSLYGLGQGVGR